MESDKPVAALIGQNGNIFNLLAIARRALYRNGQIEESDRMVSEVQQSHSYNQALEIIGRYVEFGEAPGDGE